MEESLGVEGIGAVDVPASGAIPGLAPSDVQDDWSRHRLYAPQEGRPDLPMSVWLAMEMFPSRLFARGTSDLGRDSVVRVGNPVALADTRAAGVTANRACRPATLREVG